MISVMPLLRIAERNLPKSRTTSGIEFCPLATEWKVLTLYHFTDQLDLPEGKKHSTCFESLHGIFVKIFSLNIFHCHFKQWG